MTQTTDQDRAEFEAWLAPEYSREKWHTGEYTDDTVYSMFAAWQASRRAQVVPQCPFPCGWENLHKLVVAEGAFLAKSLNECEPITTHQRDVVMRVVHYGIEMARSMLAAAPQPPACNLSMQPELATEAAAEHKALRSVYEAARGLLRYEGVDDGRAITYRTKLASAIEEVKHIDSGLWEPPEAAPVQMPEPVGVAHSGQLDNVKDGYAYVYPAGSVGADCKLYTEHQVRQILAQHGIT